MARALEGNGFGEGAKFVLEWESAGRGKEQQSASLVLRNLLTAVCAPSKATVVRSDEQRWQASHFEPQSVSVPTLEPMHVAGLLAVAGLIYIGAARPIASEALMPPVRVGPSSWLRSVQAFRSLSSARRSSSGSGALTPA